MNESLLERARSGDERAFQELTAPHHHEIQFHCYRMLGSLHDAEDALQETLVAAWRNLSGFEQRASVRTWLYRIATNRCLNTLRDARRRPQAAPVPPFELPPPSRNADPPWLEPYPDSAMGGWADPTPGPDVRYEARESVEVAFIAALQRLTGRQRATLILHDVLGYSSSEVAAMLDSSADSVKGALKRARARLDGDLGQGDGQPLCAADSARERELVSRFVEAFVADDVDGIVALLTDRAWLTMPPATLEYQGAEAIGTLLRRIAQYRAGWGVRTLAGPRLNGDPTLAGYRVDPGTGTAVATGLLALRVSTGGISRMTWFVGPAFVQRHGLPGSFSAWAPERADALM